MKLTIEKIGLVWILSFNGEEFYRSSSKLKASRVLQRKLEGLI